MSDRAIEMMWRLGAVTFFVGFFPLCGAAGWMLENARKRNKLRHSESQETTWVLRPGISHIGYRLALGVSDPPMPAKHSRVYQNDSGVWDALERQEKRMR